MSSRTIVRDLYTSQVTAIKDKENPQMWNHNYYVYITTNPTKTVLYIGVTNNLDRRLQEHEDNKANDSTFAGKYYCFNLVYYEHLFDINFAIRREKELKKWSRIKKTKLIESSNPDWQFLKGEMGD